MKPHHHGDLRAALISAGMDLLEENGIEALTLRKCAARAGVSHAAPAHHFNGLLSLKIAIIAQGHKVFAGFMDNKMKTALHTPMAQLHAVCQGYLSFSQQHNALFHLMFQAHQADFSSITPSVMVDLNKYSNQSYGMLQTACAPFENEKDAPNSTEITIWSLVHGYAMLFQAGPDNQAPSGPIPDFSLLLKGLNLRLCTPD